MIKFIKTSNNIYGHLDATARKLKTVPQEAHKYFQSITPRDTGNARAKTRLTNNDTIRADYPYAMRLDRGYSKQAPQGMSRPTIKYVRALVNKLLGR